MKFCESPPRVYDDIASGKRYYQELNGKVFLLKLYRILPVVVKRQNSNSVRGSSYLFHSKRNHNHVIRSDKDAIFPTYYKIFNLLTALCSI